MRGSKFGFLILFLPLLLASCGSGSEEQPAGDVQAEPLTLTIVFAGGDLAHKQGISTVISDFERAHPSVAIQEENESWSGSYADFLKMKDAVGEFPDLVEMRDTQLFADAGLIAPLPAEVETLLQPVPAVNGAVYAAPLEKPAPLGIIYSKALFRRAGISGPPATFGEFLELCEKIKASGVNPLVVGGKDTWHMGFWINKFLIDEVYAEQPNWNALRSERSASWGDPGPKRALERLALLWKQGDVAPGYMDTADNQTVASLLSGQAAMLYTGPWMFNQIKAADPTFEFGFFALPDANGKVNLSSMAAPIGWSISAAAARDPGKLEVLKQFLQFFYSSEEYSKYLQTVNGIPATQQSAAVVSTPLLQGILDLMDDPSTGQSAFMNNFWGDNALPAGFRDWFYRRVQDWLNGKTTLNELTAAADREWDRAKSGG
ncbi:ABC transporter substrate-binding protein [Cohnella sp. GbtcB17]|uniref:ABC transporter substrate-binding protein n=1 Tax=Cohnella sp. GbtcB17 TaxID=2824762 RepID=UPI001C2FC0EA|nr:extracellular solute-binding protein [Cohnella sp. GbtcB17]